MKKSLPIIIGLLSFAGHAQITVSTTQYTPSEIITDILSQNNNTITNISSSTGNSTDQNGIGYFEQNGSDFPFASGLILSTGNANYAAGPNINSQSVGSSTWLGDDTLYDLLGDDNAFLHNASSIEFDFTAQTDILSFEYLFASEEYGTFQCGTTDYFAFILTDEDTGDAVNLAVIPGTVTPVNTITVRDYAYNNNCPSVNVDFFGHYYEPSETSTAPINFNGCTVVMNAQASVIPNHNYNLKLVIADRADESNDSAVFISSANFNLAGNEITIVDAPSGQQNQDFAPGDTLADLEVEGENIQWYDGIGPDSTMGTLETPLPLTTLLVDGTTYYASQTIDDVESEERFAVTVHATMGIAEQSLSTLRFYPNPVNNTLNLSNSDAIDAVTVYNVMGQLLLNKNIDNTSTEVDFSNLQNGIYLVKISSSGQEKTIKIQKQ
mgnify:CR=1 FL=1